MAWKWLNSEYGGDSHAFDVDVDYEKRPYLEAPCEHTAPPGRLHPHVGGMPLCVACLVAVGSTIPEAVDWRPA